MNPSQEIIEKLQDLVNQLLEQNETLTNQLEELESQFNAAINKEYDC